MPLAAKVPFVFLYNSFKSVTVFLFAIYLRFEKLFPLLKIVSTKAAWDKRYYLWKTRHPLRNALLSCEPFQWVVWVAHYSRKLPSGRIEVWLECEWPARERTGFFSRTCVKSMNHLSHKDLLTFFNHNSVWLYETNRLGYRWRTFDFLLASQLLITFFSAICIWEGRKKKTSCGQIKTWPDIKDQWTLFNQMNAMGASYLGKTNNCHLNIFQKDRAMIGTRLRAV